MADGVAKPDPKGPTDLQFLSAMAVLGCIGALIGYGGWGNVQAACLGAGIGAAAMIWVFLLSCLP